MSVKIERKSIDEIIPYENNPRINDDAVEAVAESIRQCGYVAPIIVDESNVILAGHTRLKALKSLGYDECDVLIKSGLTEEQKKKYRVLDNKTGELALWDLDALAAEIGDIDFDGFDFGFEFPDDPHDDPIHEDDYAECVPVEAKSKRGDIYSLGEHRLMCGDSSSADDFKVLMDGSKADMVFTDPPYGVSIGDKNAALNEVQKAGRILENIENDTLGEIELYDLLKTVFINVRENCTSDACYFVTSPQGGSLGLMMMMMRDAGLPVRHVLMWKKNCATFSIGRLDYDYQHEPIFYTWTEKHHNFRGGKCRTTVWEFDKPRKADLHPTMKPVELVANAIEDGTEKGMIILDAFGGSGTTLIAAEQTGRKCYMMEIDPKYCDVIINRWETFTGNKAVLINGD